MTGDHHGQTHGTASLLVRDVDGILGTHIPPHDPEAAGPAYTYMRVADHLAARMAAGEFPPDSMLPGERALAEEYGVALGTVRRAMDELRDRGLVTTLPAKGTFVTRQG